MENKWLPSRRRNFTIRNDGRLDKRRGKRTEDNGRKYRLKKLNKKLNDGIIDFNTIRTSYESWKGHVKGKNSRKTVHSMNKLYNELFIENWHYQQVA